MKGSLECSENVTAGQALVGIGHKLVLKKLNYPFYFLQASEVLQHLILNLLEFAPFVMNVDRK